MAYASSADVAQLWAKELSEEEVSMVNRRLEQVERLILRRIPNLHERVAGGHTVDGVFVPDPSLDRIEEQDVIDIEAEAVYRVARNPEGLFMEMDGAYQYQRSREASDNRLRLTPAEWSVLGVKVGSMFAIDPLPVRRSGGVSFVAGG